MDVRTYRTWIHRKPIVHTDSYGNVTYRYWNIFFVFAEFLNKKYLNDRASVKFLVHAYRHHNKIKRIIFFDWYLHFEKRKDKGKKYREILSQRFHTIYFIILLKNAICITPSKTFEVQE